MKNLEFSGYTLVTSRLHRRLSCRQRMASQSHVIENAGEIA